MMLTERQQQILTTLIREYVRTAEPVGSEGLVWRYHLPYSPATVRLEYAALEDDGLVMHPHTSAGRVPTARGYRFFVDEGVEEFHLSRTDLRHLRDALMTLQPQYRRAARRAVKLLAMATGNLAVAGVAGTEELYEAGLSELLNEPEFSRADPVRDVTRVLDALEEHFMELTERSVSQPMVYIGEENPFVRTRHVSMLLTTCCLPSGERGLLALVGPTRMRYERNTRLLEETARLLESAEEAWV